MRRALVFLLFGPLILRSALSVLQGDPTAIGWAASSGHSACSSDCGGRLLAPATLAARVRYAVRLLGGSASLALMARWYRRRNFSYGFLMAGPPKLAAWALKSSQSGAPPVGS